MSKIGRNDPCPCGSGKKYKKCCLHTAPEGKDSSESRPAHPLELELQKLIATGYKHVDEKEWGEGASVWLQAWELLKPILQEASVTSIDAVDELVDLGQAALNWTQDLEHALQSQAGEDAAHYRLLVEYTEEFSQFLPHSGLTTKNMRRSHAEALFFSGEPERGEAAFRQIVRDYPGWAWGYIGWADVYWLFRPDCAPIDYERALSLYKKGLKYNEDPDDIVAFQERLQELSERAGWSYEEMVKDVPQLDPILYPYLRGFPYELWEELMDPKNYSVGEPDEELAIPGTPGEVSSTLRRSFFEIVENQIRDDEPPKTRETLKRLVQAGYSPLEALEKIARVVIEEVWHVTSNRENFNSNRFEQALEALE